jgi:hypothetical protein
VAKFEPFESFLSLTLLLQLPHDHLDNLGLGSAPGRRDGLPVDVERDLLLACRSSSCTVLMSSPFAAAWKTSFGNCAKKCADSWLASLREESQTLNISFESSPSEEAALQV